MTAASTISRLGRYQLTRVLGQGAMGVVYEGLDPALGRPVAVKTILRSALHDADTAADTSARFVREAQAIARLSHPHIVMVFDFGEEGDVAYFVMEFVRGRDLKTALDDGESFSIAETVRIIGELLAALDFAHQHGVVHRDVKPANVMIDAAGHVKLTDFGVARLADSNGERTMAGTMVGTPSYMSPEQILGQPVGSRTDIFAVGIILYQCLTGIKPFLGPGTWAIQKQIVHDDPVPPSVARPEIDPAFDAVVAKALAKEPLARFASAAEFADALRAAAKGAAEISPPPAKERVVTATGPEAMVMATVVEPATASAEPTISGAAVGGPAVVAKPVPNVSRSRSWGAMALAGAGVLGLGVFLLRPGAPTSVPAAPVANPVQAPAAVSAPPVASAPLPAQPAAAPQATAAVEKPAVAPVVKLPAVESPKPSVEVARHTVARAAQASASDRPPSAPAKPGRARCDDLLQRFQIGDTLSPDELNALQKECHK